MQLDRSSLQKVILPTGVELHYARHGSGEKMIMIHGAMGDWRSWEPQWEVLTSTFDCVSYSRRYSYPNDNRMASPDHSAIVEAQDLRGLLNELGWSQSILMGSSYGAFTALALAVSVPERVRAIVAVEPPMMRYAYLSERGRHIAERFRQEIIVPARKAFEAGNDLEAARLMTGGIVGPAAGFGPDYMQRRMANVQAMKMLALSADEFPWIAPETLRSIKSPVLLMSGEDTPDVHAAIFDEVAAAMPRARVVRVPGAGHGVARDRPEYFNEAVVEFVGQLRSAEAGDASVPVD